MKARIYKPAKNAMQSGTAKDWWLLEYEPAEQKYVDPLMGWTGSGDMNQQLRLTFETMEEAVAYAEEHNIPYIITLPKPRKHIKKSYADNFAYVPPAQKSPAIKQS